MADWDSADLLARVRRDGRISTSAAFPVTADIYAWLTRAEAHWKPKLAGQYPYHMFSVPTQMTTSDSGVTYVFPSETAPLAVEIYAALVGPRLIAGQFGDSNADYVWEGSQIRMTTNTARTFPSGPYARWVDSPGTIDGSTEPTLAPTFTRQLLVDRALIYWARASQNDPRRFIDQETETWTEVQEALKQSNMFYGDASISQTPRGSGLGYLLARRFR